MFLIGMTGPIGHGKSTFAEALQKLEPSTFRIEFSTIVIEVANAMHAALQSVPQRDDIDAVNSWLRSLPAILLQSVHTKVTFEQIALDSEQILRHPVEYEKLFLHIDNLNHDKKLAKKNITRENKEEYRPFLQWLGGYLVQGVDPAIWQKEILSRIRQAGQQGCKLCVVGGLRYPADAAALKTMDAKIIKVYRPGHLQYDVLDPTERERENISTDCTIMSNGDVSDLNNCARAVLDDLRAGKLQSLYQTSRTKL